MAAPHRIAVAEVFFDRKIKSTPRLPAEREQHRVRHVVLVHALQQRIGRGETDVARQSQQLLDRRPGIGTEHELGPQPHALREFDFEQLFQMRQVDRVQVSRCGIERR